MNQSENIEELAKAMCNAQKERLFALTDSENPFFKSRYADLSSVWAAAREPLTKNGLSVIQTLAPGDNGSVVIVTTLLHESGQWIRGELSIAPVKSDPQSMGSAITYGRRYSLAAIVGICPEDDDAEGSMGREEQKKEVAVKKSIKKKQKSESEDSGNKDEPATDAQRKKLYAMCRELGMDRDQSKEFYDFLCVRYLTEKLTKNQISQVFDNWEDVTQRFWEDKMTTQEDQ